MVNTRPALYLCPSDHSSHLLELAIGILEQMRSSYGRVGIFRPIVTAESDPLVEALASTTHITASHACGVSTDEILDKGDHALATIISRYAQASAGYDAMLVLGSDYDSALKPIEYAWNATIATNISAPLAVVVPSDGTVEAVNARIKVAIDEAIRHHAQVAAAITVSSSIERKSLVASVPAFVVEPTLVHDDALSALIRRCEGSLIAGRADERQKISTVVCADMSITDLLPKISGESVVLFDASREDIPLALVVAAQSGHYPRPAAAIAAGSSEVKRAVLTLWNEILPTTPLISTKRDMGEISRQLSESHYSSIQINSVQIEQAKRHCERDLDFSALMRRPAPIGSDEVVTPLMFEHQLLERARAVKKHIVLPEGVEPRIVKAAERLIEQKICRLTLLGERAAVERTIAEAGVTLDGVEIVDPAHSPWREEFAEKFAKMRAKKGVTYEQAYEQMADLSYFGTMMVHCGYADGMVSGSITTTAATIRPALQIVKTKPGASVVSSALFICLSDQVMVFSDCAVNPNPTPEQVADIALTTAETARQFGIDPKVALLSYSTGTSGKGPDVDQTIEATRLVKERDPNLAVEGPIQYDAAVDPSVAATKLPNSQVAGQANVMIFPDLKTGNIGYKAIQRSSGALAIGPVLQGLNKPINDLSRGALVADIVNTVAITAIQASM